jgi:hypothetical protein
MVLVPEAMGAVRAVKLDYLISLGTTKSITITANKGIALEILENSSASSLVPYINRAIHAIEGLGASRATIANLDFMDPFPALFLAPAPKGVQVMWAFDYTRVVPVGYSPSWQEIIGDACVVTQPKHSPIPPAIFSEPLIAAAEPHLATAFTPEYEDELWKIWKHRGGCGATGGQVESRLDKSGGNAADLHRHF